MLGAYYRFRVKNRTDQTFTYDNDARIELKIIPWKFVSGAVEQQTVISVTTDFLDSGETIAASSEVESAVIDNTSDLNIGFTGTFYGKADVTSTDGTLDLFMEMSTDNSRWPSDMADFDIEEHMIFIGALTFSTDAVDEDAAVDVVF